MTLGKWTMPEKDTTTRTEKSKEKDQATARRKPQQERSTSRGTRTTSGTHNKYRGSKPYMAPPETQRRNRYVPVAKTEQPVDSVKKPTSQVRKRVTN